MPLCLCDLPLSNFPAEFANESVRFMGESCQLLQLQLHLQLPQNWQLIEFHFAKQFA